MFWQPADRISWEGAPKGKGPQRVAQASRLLSLLKAGQTTRNCRKMGVRSRRPDWLNRKLFAEFKCEKEVYGAGSRDGLCSRNRSIVDMQGWSWVLHAVTSCPERLWSPQP